MSTHNIPIFNISKKVTLNYPKSAAMGFFSKGLKKEFETAMVNEPSMFEPLKFYCTLHDSYTRKQPVSPHKQQKDGLSLSTSMF